MLTTRYPAARSIRTSSSPVSSTSLTTRLGAGPRQRREVALQVRLGAMLVAVFVEQLRHERVAVDEQEPEAMVGQLVGELQAVIEVAQIRRRWLAQIRKTTVPARHPAAGGDRGRRWCRCRAPSSNGTSKSSMTSGDELARRSRSDAAANQLDAPGLPHHGVVGELAVDALLEQRAGPAAGFVRARRARRGAARGRTEDSESALAGAKPLDRASHRRRRLKRATSAGTPRRRRPTRARRRARRPPPRPWTRERPAQRGGGGFRIHAAPPSAGSRGHRSTAPDRSAMSASRSVVQRVRDQWLSRQCPHVLARHAAAFPPRGHDRKQAAGLRLRHRRESVKPGQRYGGATRGITLHL